MRVAALLGLHNVGTGSIGAAGRVDIAPGLSIAAGESARDLAAGRQVMWRVSSHALAVNANGAHAGVIEAVELRRGERYVRVNIAGVRFDLASEDAALRDGAPCRVDIRAAGVTVWGIGDPQPLRASLHAHAHDA
jgi:molybdate transport system permease protein